MSQETVLARIWSALGGPPAALSNVRFTGEGALPSVFAVSDLAAGAAAAAGLAAAHLLAAAASAASPPPVQADRRLASLWFAEPVRPVGWTLPPAWDAVAGDYQASDGWIRLHTNAPHHREAALRVLGVPAEREAVAAAVARWDKTMLETAIVEAGGCAAAMNTLQEWASHPQGAAVAAEPLLHWSAGDAARSDWRPDPARPLRGIRVLDLTRVLAGPVATRTLAGLGATVLRIDPPGWDEPGVLPGVMAGKRAARLDLRSASGRAVFQQLLSGADLLVHGYRNGALDGLGFDHARRQALRPGLVEVCLDAYGWTGPWRQRRGFDSLVQMSSGIADAGMRRLNKPKPHPLPVQALDHACGYIMAAAALMGLARRLTMGEGSLARASLARTAALLVGETVEEAPAMAPAGDDDFAPDVEATAWGSVYRLRSPLTVGGVGLRWDVPAGLLGSAAAAWP